MKTILLLYTLLHKNTAQGLMVVNEQECMCVCVCVCVCVRACVRACVCMCVGLMLYQCPHACA